MMEDEQFRVLANRPLQLIAKVLRLHLGACACAWSSKLTDCSKFSRPGRAGKRIAKRIRQTRMDHKRRIKETREAHRRRQEKLVAQWRASREYRDNYLNRKAAEKGLADLAKPSEAAAQEESV